MCLRMSKKKKKRLVGLEQKEQGVVVEKVTEETPPMPDGLRGFSLKKVDQLGS